MKRILFTLALLGSMFTLASAQTGNFNMVVAGTLPYNSPQHQDLSNIWGFVDTVGNEYALIGAANGLSIVDVTVPTNPVEVAFIPAPGGSGNCTWREVKTIGRYAYVTTECGTPGLQIVDLRNLPGTNLPSATWAPTIMSTQLKTIHALDVEGTKLYLYGHNIGNKGFIIADVASNPMNPTYLGIYNGSYVHDGEVRGNTAYAGHIYAGYFSVTDVSNPAAPVDLQTQNTPGNFTHNTWTSTNGNYLFTTDEVSNSYLASYDISNINNIQLLDKIQVTPGSGSIVHNTYTINVGGNDYEVVSWYRDGVVIVDAGRPNNLVVVAHYDTYPQDSGNGFNGTWGVYPWLPSGNIVSSNIEDGLFVLTPTYQRACYLEGTITDANTSLPIFGANAVINSLNLNGSSDATGFYGTGCAAAGSYSVTYSKAGYVSQTVTVSLSNGVVTTQNIQLVPLTSFAVTGQVVQSWNNAGIPNAHVRIYNALYNYDTITDANGNYTIPAMYDDTFMIVAGKWTFKNKCVSNVHISQSLMPPVMALDSAIYDEFTWDYNWSISGNAQTGMWERGEPLGTSYNNPGDANPEYDVSTDCTDECYVTGNTGQTSSDDDVDNGYTLMTSPTFSLIGYNNPVLDYYRWFFNAGGFGNPNDSIRVYINNGNTTVQADFCDVNGQLSAWVHKIVPITPLITPTATMQVMVRVADASPGHIVEGGFDRFWVRDSVLNSVHDIQWNNFVHVYPNPYTSQTSVDYSLANAVVPGAMVIVTDVTGRTVEQLPVTAKAGVVQVGGELGAGIYFVRIINGREMTEPMKVVKMK
ncbi:MAG TPA: choice-of-anchor B family protein [Bacteroidia bacterium]|jgi:choice-of-anchor B domain-containing protein